MIAINDISFLDKHDNHSKNEGAKLRRVKRCRVNVASLVTFHAGNPRVKRRT